MKRCRKIPHTDGYSHRISIPAYAVEQQWWQSGVPKNEMSLIFKIMLVLYQSVSLSGSISNIYWFASKWSSISFSYSQCPSDRDFSFPRFVGILILSLWLQLITCHVKLKMLNITKWFDQDLMFLKGQQNILDIPPRYPHLTKMI
jgi:hypothetical protein